MLQRVASVQISRRILGIYMSDAPNVLRRHARDRRDLCRRIRLDPLGQRVQPRGPARHKRDVVQRFGQDDVNQAQRQRQVCTWPGRHVNIGPGRRARATRIDNDQLGATLLGLQQATPGGRNVAGGGIGSPQQHTAHVFGVKAVHTGLAIGQLFGNHRGERAHVLVTHQVGRAIQVHKALHPPITDKLQQRAALIHRQR